MSNLSRSKVMKFKSTHLIKFFATAVFASGFCATLAPAAQRGRPYLNAARTTFVGDNGQPLRGPFTSTEWTGPVGAHSAKT